MKKKHGFLPKILISENIGPFWGILKMGACTLLS
jgi:hypothetical protein